LLTTAEAELVSDSARLASALDSFARCIGLKRENAAYVSTPITTGRRYYEWLKSSGMTPTAGAAFQAEHARQVIEVNQASARALVLYAREKLRKIVVDPTALDVPIWTQDDYNGFWTHLISDYVGTVVFNDGWEYSTGCTLEYAAALESNARLLDSRLSALPPTLALMSSNHAVAELKGQGHSISGLIVAQRRIEKAIASSGSGQSV
jgi:hypothetical protein